MKTNKRILFLDLEETIIDPVLTGWQNTAMMNVYKIKQFIKEFNPTEVSIFSFAIHNARDKEGFNIFTRKMIEESLDVKITNVPTMIDDIIPACCAQKQLALSKVTISDMIDFWGKQESFRLFLRQTLRDRNLIEPIEIVLIDDVVFDEDFHWPDINVNGRIINLYSL